MRWRRYGTKHESKLYSIQCASLSLQQLAPTGRMTSGHDTTYYMAGKMKQTLCFDWLHKWGRWSYTASCSLQEQFLLNPLLTKLVWPRWLNICQVLVIQKKDLAKPTDSSHADQANFVNNAHVHVTLTFYMTLWSICWLSWII